MAVCCLMTTPRPFAEAQPHGEIRQLFDDIYFVTGSMTLREPLPMRFSRNMVILRHGDELTLVNSVRLDEQGLRQLDQLGQVKHVFRLAAFHGCDDPFYQARYDAVIWSVDAPYVPGMKRHPRPEECYFSPDRTLTDRCELPLANADYLEIKTCFPLEGLLLLHRDGGIMICGDAFQNWPQPDDFFDTSGKLFLRLMGSFKPCIVGPEWYRLCRPDPEKFINVLDYPFEHLLPAHGEPVLHNAHARFEPAMREMHRMRLKV